MLMPRLPYNLWCCIDILRERERNEEEKIFALHTHIFLLLTQSALNVTF